MIIHLLVIDYMYVYRPVTKTEWQIKDDDDKGHLNTFLFNGE